MQTVVSEKVPSVMEIVGSKGSTHALNNGGMVKVTAKAGEKYHIIKKKGLSDELADNVVVTKVEDSLSLQYADGTQVSLEGFYTQEGAEVALPASNGGVHTVASQDAVRDTLVYSHGDHDLLMSMTQSDHALQMAVAQHTSISNLPHYAELATGVASDASAGTTAAAATTATGLSTAMMVGLGALGVAGVAATAGGSDGGSVNNSSSVPVSANTTTISGSVVLGPVVANHSLTVTAFNVYGIQLATGAVNADGTYVLTIIGSYTGAMLLRVVDANAGADYMDEATGMTKDLNGDLRAVTVIPFSGTYTVNLNVLTELVVQELGLLGGDNGTSSVGLIGITETHINTISTHVATAVGLRGVNLMSDEVKAIITANGEDDSANANDYGKILAAFSGQEKGTGKSTAEVIATMKDEIDADAGTLSDAGKDALITGANHVDNLNIRQIATGLGVTTATITMADTALTVGETSLVTITFSAAVTGFTIEDLIVENGALSNLVQIGTSNVWTATFTPTATITDTTNSISFANTTGTTTITTKTITGTADNDSLTGTSEEDTIFGNAGSDWVYAGLGDDTLVGGDGNDRLFGEAGNDTILGGDGNDLITGGAGADILDGGSGDDSLYYNNDTSGVTINLANHTASGGEAQGDTISGFESAMGGESNDRLTGSSVSNSLYGYAGNDIIDGGDGDDTIQGGEGTDKLDGGIGNDLLDYSDEATSNLTIDLGANKVSGGRAEGDTIANFEKATGGSKDDTLIGSSGDNKFYGGAGNDTITGGAGNDTITGGAGNDTIYGDTGSDTVVFSGNRADYTVTYNSKDEAYSITDKVANRDGTDSIKGAESLQFADGIYALSKDTVTATTTIDLIDSSDSGTSNNDNITSDATPTLAGMAKAGATVEIKDGTTVIGTTTADASGNWSFTPLSSALTTAWSGISSMNPNSGTTTIIAGNVDSQPKILDENNNAVKFTGTINAGAISAYEGNDTVEFVGNVNNVDMGSGDDTVKFDAAVNGFVLLDSGNDSAQFATNANQINAGAGDDKIKIEGTANNIIDLGDGDDYVSIAGNGNEVIGGAGNDTIIIGGVANNTITTGTGNDSVSIAGNAGAVNLQDGDDFLTISGTANSALDAGIGNDTLLVNQVNGSIVMGDGNDILVVKGTTINNSLKGGAGMDSLYLQGYTKAQWDSNTHQIQSRVTEFENIKFADGEVIGDASAFATIRTDIFTNGTPSTGMADGVHTLRATDTTENTTSSPINVTIDTTAPTAVLSSVISQVQLEATGVTNDGDYAPQITSVGTNGEYVVTYYGADSSANSDRDYSIFVQKFNSDGTTQGTQVQLEATGVTNMNDFSPQITSVGTNGEYVIAYYGADSSGGDYSIFVQKFNSDGTTQGGQVQLEATGAINGSDESPQITEVGANGEYVVTYTGVDSEGDFSIFVQKFNANGTTQGTQVQLEATGKTDGFDDRPQITALGTSGEYVVTYTGKYGNTDGNNSIFVQKFNADGTTQGTQVQLEATGGMYFPHERLSQVTSVGTNGEYVVAYDGKDEGGDTSIFVQKFNSNGTTQGTKIVLEATGIINGNEEQPQITSVGTNGEYVVTFTGDDSAGHTSIFVQKFNANGIIQGTQAQLEATGVTDQCDIHSQITAVGASGEYVVTYEGMEKNGDTSIFVQKFNSDGTTQGGQVKLEATGKTDGIDYYPQITSVGTTGEYVVTFGGSDIDGDIFVQKFNADGTIQQGAGVLAKSSEVGTAYLVKDSVTITDVLSITGANDNLWNSVAITTANTDTAMSTAGLTSGNYHLYALDTAGNFGAMSIGSYAVI